MCSQIGEYQHVIVLLIDGLGYHFKNKLSRKSTLLKSLNQKLVSVYPSATATALTSFTTASFPNKHNITGWWVYLDNYKTTASVLPFFERFTRKDLGSLGIPANDIFPIQSIFTQYKSETFFHMPNDISNSTFSKYFNGNRDSISFDNIEEGLQNTLKIVNKNNKKTFQYMYVSELDSIAHRNGTDSLEVDQFIEKLTSEIEQYKEKMPSNTRLIITSDHGQINVPPEKNQYIYPNDPILNYLKAPPSGEPRGPIFHVQDGKSEKFIRYFNSRYQNQFTLFSIEELQKLGLYGPGELSEITKIRLGNFVAIPKSPTSLTYIKSERNKKNFIAFHGGLSLDEIEIPLFIL